MSQNFDKTLPADGVTTFGTLYSKIRNNIEALLTAHAGSSEPTYKEVGVIWAKLDASNYIEKFYIYTGDTNISTDGYVGWAEISISNLGLGAELINARGTKSSLDQRLDVALNDDGTLKASVTETTAGEWLNPGFTWTNAYQTSTTFKVSGDQTDIYTPKRRLKVSLSGSTVYTEVLSATYSSPDTTVTVKDSVLTDPIAKIEHGIIQPSGANSSLPSAVKLDIIDERTIASGITIDGVLLKDSQVTTDIINEKTTDAGITIDGVLLKDSEVTTNVINEKTTDAGVTADGVLLKDSQVNTDIINEKTPNTGVTIDGCLIKDNGVNAITDQGGGNVLKCKVLNIGDWNMDTTVYVDISHGLTLSNIRCINVIIRNDDDTKYYDFPINSTNNTSDGHVYAGNTNIRITRATDSIFDSLNFDSTSYNRGWITIWYV